MLSLHLLLCITDKLIFIDQLCLWVMSCICVLFGKLVLRVCCAAILPVISLAVPC